LLGSDLDRSKVREDVESAKKRTWMIGDVRLFHERGEISLKNGFGLRYLCYSGKRIPFEWDLASSQPIELYTK
jgi:hypothetical protein